MDDNKQVLISGGGPVGLSAAVELGLRGIPCVVIEPRAQPTRTRPRAKTLNIRTMEHLRRWGYADRLRAVAPLPTWWSQDVAFCSSLLGPEITRFSGVLGLSDEGVSPELGQQMPQYVLEETLRDIVRELPDCTMLVGSRVAGIHQNDDGVEVTVADSTGSRRKITAEFVLGADGARSAVRDAIGAQYVGTHALRPNLGVAFRCKELLGLLPHRPAVQSWLVNDRTPGVMGPVDRDGTWWLIAFGVDNTPDEADLPGIVEGALGHRLPIEIVSTDPWTARMELADRCRDGRVFLIGDAAHLNPPFGGHGLNTGIGDAVDIGWKLAATIDGWGGPGLLDSYEAERRPLQQRVIAEAAANMSVLSTELVRDSVEDSGTVGQQARKEVAEQIWVTKHAEYFSLDLALGHRYSDSPIIPDVPADRGSDDDWRSVVRPGRRIPHHWVSPDASTLDLIGPGFTVLTRPGTQVDPLADAAVARELPLTVRSVGDDVAALLGAQFTIVRPDQIVAWCGDALPANPGELLDRLTGIACPSANGDWRHQ